MSDISLGVTCYVERACRHTKTKLDFYLASLISRDRSQLALCKECGHNRHIALPVCKRWKYNAFILTTMLLRLSNTC